MIFRHLLNMRSHPTWVRGLKLIERESIKEHSASHPTWVRGLKHQSRAFAISCIKSHPTWVRGLKLGLHSLPKSGGFVAPYVGAWIETVGTLFPCQCPVSRTLRGCVD